MCPDFAKMPLMDISLGYGKTPIDFEFSEQQFDVLASESTLKPLSDSDIGEKLDDPIDSKPLEEAIKPGESVLIVVPDATREIGCGQIVNLLVRRLIAAGSMPYDINIVFATGIHRPVNESEKELILTPFIAQRIKTLNHKAQDLMNFVRLGETSSGIPIELNRNLTEFDHTIIVGGINFHYFAGFTGGRKLICPGLASSRTIAETHKLAFDFERKTRRDGVEVGSLANNPVHEAFIEVVEKCPPSFAISTFVNDKGEIVDLVCGDWKSSHEKACELYLKRNTLKISEKREVVVVSAGGFPHDVNLIQAHKALEMGSHACADGGTIVFLAECAEGFGRDDFIEWFEVEDSRGIAESLCEKYQVNGQTAWSLRKKTEHFNVKIISSLPKDATLKMGMKPIERAHQTLSDFQDKKGFILPFGAKFKIEKGG